MTHTKKALGIDIGGTKICYGIVDDSGNILSEIKRTSTPKNAQEIFETLKKIIDENYNDIDVIGLSSAGAVNLENTKVVSSTPNLPSGYNNIDFSTLSNKKVYVENDANCATIAEFVCGSMKGYDNAVMLTIGTGIGGGIILGGKMAKGSYLGEGELGHTIVDYTGGEYCGCGQKG